MIKNFLKVEVDYPLYRGGQPNTQADWDSLWALGIKRVIKLNMDYEGADAVPATVPLMKCPIDLIHMMVGGIDQQAIVDTVGFIDSGTFVHCTHGQDRTGLIIAIYRLTKCDWSKKKAQQEMLKLGFHKEMLGLWRFWKKWA